MASRLVVMPREAALRHVLMVIESDYPSADGGGAEAQVETLCRNRPGSLGVSVVAPLLPFGPQSASEVVHGAAVTRLRYPRLPLIGGGVLLIRLACLIVLRRRSIDAIHCHIAHNMAAVACALGRILDIPVVVKLTGMMELEQGILSDRRSPAIALKRWLIRRATAIQAISDELEARLIAKGFDPQKVHRLPNAVDTRLFAPDAGRKTELKTRLGIEAAFVACFVGRLAPEKALDTLIEAWDRAIPKEASACLALVGTGVMEPALRDLAARLGRQHQVVFAGFVSDKSVIADYWRISDLGMLTSDFEGLSNALLEAMASAVPMIASRVSGNIDLIVAGRTGWLFEPRRIDQLAACLGEAFAMAADERRAMAEAARQTALVTVGVDHVWDRLIRLYQDAGGEAMALCAE